MQFILHLLLAYSIPLVALISGTILVIFNHPYFAILLFIIFFLSIPIRD